MRNCRIGGKTPGNTGVEFFDFAKKRTPECGVNATSLYGFAGLKFRLQRGDFSDIELRIWHVFGNRR